MARNVADLALFLDAMAGFCPHDPMTFDAPPVSFSAGLRRPVVPKRVAFTADYGGRDAGRSGNARALRRKAARRFEELGCMVEESAPDIGATTRRSCPALQHFVVDRELQLRSHRDKLKPDIIWNTERGLAQTPSRSRPGRPRARRLLSPVDRVVRASMNLAVTPGAATPAFDVNLRNARDDRRQETQQLYGRLNADTR